MKIIGLCGGSGSGKGTVSKLFLKHGIPSIDTDAVYHSITSELTPCVSELAARFGEGIIKSDGSLDRRSLGRIVFSDESGLSGKDLNRITHKYVLERVREIITEYGASGVSAVLVDAPMLFESGFDKECHKIICVLADKNIRIARILIRDGISYEDAERRIASQLSDTELASRCDFVIENNKDIDDLDRRVREIVNLIK